MMGLNLRRVDFSDWIIQTIPKKERQSLVNLICQNIKGYNSNNFPYEEDDEYPRIGSYGAYDVFRICLTLVTGESIDMSSSDLDDDDIWVINYFKENLNVKPVEIPHANHILMTSDCETVFLPVLFEKPFEFNDYSFGSSPAVIIALESFANVLDFDLSEPEDLTEMNPVILSKKIAKIIYHFLKEKPNVAVELC